MGAKSEFLLVFAICLFLVVMLLLISNLRRAKDMLQKSKKDHDFLRILLDAIPNPIFSKNIDGEYIGFNTAFEQYLGLIEEQIINKTDYEINQGKILEIYDKADSELMQRKGKQTYESKVIYADGSEHDVLLNKATLIDKNNRVMGLVGVMLDITERKIYEQKISRSLNLNQAMLQVSQSIIGINNTNELFELILEKAISIIENAQFGSVLILDEDGMLKIAVSKGYNINSANNFSISLQRSFLWIKTMGNIERTIIINDIAKLHDVNLVNVCKSRDPWDIKSCISAPIIIENKLYGMINVDSKCADVFSEEDLVSMEHFRSQIEIAISKQKLYEETIYLSRYDKLTNVFNRRYFEEMFDLYFNKALRYSEEFQLAIFDLNGLKIVNDTYGHLAGDKYIQTFANKLKSNVRSSDILARYGGDEFIAIYWGTNLKSLDVKLEELLKQLKNNPFSFEGNQIVCSFSYGIVSFPQEAQSYNQLVKVADDRMYENKREIKSTI
ncbi:sensor domain-containing diguanylate cyclase [Clostridium sp.]|uniref:sensor domain-containing diguanylate cyclase n=1 Tax=Clostridium sp. TaxID=1506 RepID=UPI003D6CA429